jgi:uroporphyrinogen decarboxylase
MTSRERVRAALAHRAPDQVPVGEFTLTHGTAAELLGADAASISFAAWRDLLLRLGFDLLAAYPRLPDGRELMSVHEAAGIHPPEPLATSLAQRFGLPRPEELDWTPIHRLHEESPFFTLAVVPGPFGDLAYLRGFTSFLARTLSDPGRLAEEAEAMVDYALSLATAALGHGAEGVIIADDLAHQRGPYMRPDVFRHVFLPALRRQVEALHAYEVPVFFHSDGDLTLLLDDLVETGIDVLHPLEPLPGQEPATLRARLGRRVALWGGLPLDDLLILPEEQLARRVEALLALGAEGGYIFGTTAAILEAVPAARVELLYHLVRTHRRPGDPGD